MDVTTFHRRRQWRDKDERPTLIDLVKAQLPEMSESDRRALDHAYGFLAGMAFMGAVVVVLLMITWRGA